MDPGTVMIDDLMHRVRFLTLRDLREGLEKIQATAPDSLLAFEAVIRAAEQAKMLSSIKSKEGT